MYLTMRVYRGARSPTEIGERAMHGLVPMLKQIPGFYAYYAAVTVETRCVFGITLFDDREISLAANERMRQWVVEKLSDLLPSPPDVTGGEVLHQFSMAEGALAAEDRMTIVTLDIFGAFEENMQRVHDALSHHASAVAGIRHLFALRSESHTNRGVFIVLHDGSAAKPDDMRRLLEEPARDTLLEPPTVSTGKVMAAAIC
jgi:hypothetical protein